jgi:nucleoside-diphosphate-sugar epimerase
MYLVSVLITGITGFIGSNLAKRLVEDGYDVYGLVRHVSRSDFRSFELVQDRVRFVEGDLTEYHSVRAAVGSVMPETLVHLGALTPVRYSFDDPFPYMKVNTQGTVNLVHAVLESSPNIHLIVASTAEVYGWQPKEPTVEDVKLTPSSPYGVSKAAADTYVQMATKVYGLKSTLLRCNNTYGRTEEKGFLVEYLVSSMLKNNPVYIGTPKHVRDYMFVDDHVDAYVRVLKQKPIGEVFNVSPGNPTTNLELAKKIAKITSYKGRIVEGSYPPAYPVRPNQWDTEYIVLNSDRLRTRLGWKPTLTLDEGLSNVVDAWRSLKPDS